MEKPVFESYRRQNGHDEFGEWLKKLPISDRAKILRVITDTQDQGLLIAQRLNWVKKIQGEKNLYEIRSKVSTNIQRVLYFHAHGSRYVITHGFTKKSAKTPKSEINHAISLRKEFESNNEN